MEEDFSSEAEDIIDIVRGLQDVDVDISGGPLSEDNQGGENVKLGSDCYD